MNEALAKSSTLSKISQLIIDYPWNNFLQLKVINIYEIIVDDHSLKSDHRRELLQRSNIAKTILQLTSDDNVNFKHASSKKIRHGYMALITKISNLLEKNKDKSEIQEYLSSIPEWSDYVQGELKRSNENNDKSLGGQ